MSVCVSITGCMCGCLTSQSQEEDRNTIPCCSPYGCLNRDGSRQMDRLVDINPLYEVMELACVCALILCHS